MAFLAGLCLSLSACASTEVYRIEKSGNFQIEADEARLWKRAEELEEILNNGGFIYQDEELTKYVNGVLHKLVGDYEKSNNVKLKAYIIKDPFFNAFCLPNGVIYLHTSILANADNEAQLATVLGHEATHFLYRHQLKETRSAINKTAFLSAWQVTLGSAPGIYGSAAALANLLGAYCVIGSFYGYSRELEREADKNAFELVKNAGYPYSETRKVMENFYEATKDDKEKIPYFYSTHPQTKERVKEFDHLIMNLSKEEGKKAKTGAPAKDPVYDRMIRNLLLDNAKLDMKRNNLKLAKKAILRYNKLCPDDPQGPCLLGQVYTLEDKKDDAEKEFKDSIKFDPTYPESHKFLGMLFYKKGEKKKAKTEFEEYLRLNPEAKDAEYIRGYLNE